jgi:hypothetical protein
MNLEIFIQFAYDKRGRHSFAYEVQKDGKQFLPIYSEIVHNSERTVKSRHHVIALSHISKMLGLMKKEGLNLFFYTQSSSFEAFITSVIVTSRHNMKHSTGTMRNCYMAMKRHNGSVTSLPLYGGALKRVDEEANRVLSPQNFLAAAVS